MNGIVKKSDETIPCLAESDDQSAASSELSYCSLFDIKDEIDYQQFSWIIFNLNFWLLIPIWTFFWLHDPHDCYTCLGKDPDRIYSRFQLNVEERARRQLIAKFNHRYSQRVLAGNSHRADVIYELLKNEQSRSMMINSNIQIWQNPNNMTEDQR